MHRSVCGLAVLVDDGSLSTGTLFFNRIALSVGSTFCGKRKGAFAENKSLKIAVLILSDDNIIPGTSGGIVILSLLYGMFLWKLYLLPSSCLIIIEIGAISIMMIIWM